jgi:hypothetical protein
LSFCRNFRRVETLMAGSNPPQRPDPDDWWAGTTSTRAPADDRSAGGRPQSEDSLASRGGRALQANLRLALAIGLGLVALLVIGLALGGAFSSGNTHTVTPPTTAPTTTAATLPTHTAPPALPAAGISLKTGASGAPVRLLQRALAALGYSPGKVDGQFGPSTQQALIRFQNAAHLTPDGVYGPKTRAALAQALQAQQ